MATRFELVLYGEDPVHLRAAGEEALAEIKRLEEQLSFYRSTSAISRLNADAAEAPVRVEPWLFELLARGKQLHAATEGAFDIALAPLMRAWGFTGGGGRRPSEQQLAEARRVSGLHLVHLDATARTVRFERPGVALDLGAIGKGYALDEAALLLREAGVEAALLHGGTSSIVAIGHPPEASAWSIALPSPTRPDPGAGGDDLLAVVPLADLALGVSAAGGKAFTADGVTYGHVLDPRTGRPTTGALLTAVAAPTAAEADALSTALLVLGRETTALPIHDHLRYLIALPPHRGAADPAVADSAVADSAAASFSVIRQHLHRGRAFPHA